MVSRRNTTANRVFLVILISGLCFSAQYIKQISIYTAAKLVDNSPKTVMLAEEFGQNSNNYANIASTNGDSSFNVATNIGHVNSSQPLIDDTVASLSGTTDTNFSLVALKATATKPESDSSTPVNPLLN